MTAARGATRLETYPIKLGARWTTIRVEPEMMHALREIALTLGVGLNELCTEIALGRSDGSFTSSLRVFVVNHYRRLIGSTEAAKGDGYRVKRRRLQADAKDVVPELVDLWQWWHHRRPRPRGVPPHSSIDPGLLQRLGFGGMVHAVDARSGDPLNFRFRIFGERVVAAGGRDFAGCRIADLPGRDYRTAAAEDYLTVATTGVPRLQEVDASVGMSQRIYQRLIVPFSESGGGTDCLLIAVRYKTVLGTGKPREHPGAQNPA
ncbi:MAG: ribbon-helix-helix domain-containing protein [Proteobacteria bacterium]|nr:ribbon-helix-helix domain-containing protein [Pseudomonadota bacterium]